MKSKSLLCLIVLCISLCFGIACNESGSKSGDTTISSVNLSLTVSNSRSFNPNINHGAIDYYQVTVTGPDLNTPFVERFDGDADSAKMLGIPSGESRTILIEAFNPNGVVIRRGLKEGVAILPGKSTAVIIVMNSVPIFTNITDKSAVAGNRLEFGIFGEPGSQLEVLNVTNEESVQIIDQNTGEATVDTSNEEGLFSVSPQDFDYGVYSFGIKDVETGETSTVTITLYQETVRPGIAVNAGGLVDSKGGEMVLANTGQFYHRNVVSKKDNLGNDTMLDIVDLLY